MTCIEIIARTPEIVIFDDVSTSAKPNRERRVLGVYCYGGGQGLRAAPVDVKTGEFLSPGVTTFLDTPPSLGGLSLALGKVMLSNELKKDAAVGVALPIGSKEGKSNELSVAGLNRVKQALWEKSLSREKAARIAMMNVAEAYGYAEMAYGAGKKTPRNSLVLVVTVGKGLGCALFDKRLLMRNVGYLVQDLTQSWANPRVMLPSELPGEASDAARRKLWETNSARLVAALQTLVDRLSPESVIVTGHVVTGELYGSIMQPALNQAFGDGFVTRGDLDILTAGVKGAAFGAATQLGVRTTLETLKVQIGKAERWNPETMSNEQLRAVFDKMDTSQDGFLQADEIVRGLSSLGIATTAADGIQILTEIDTANQGKISFDQFKTWVLSHFSPSQVAWIFSEEELDKCLTDHPGKLVVLLVAATWCRPCKKFGPKFADFSKKYSDAIFLRVNGNENSSTVHMGRDRLKIKSSPTCVFFRNGQVLGMMAGSSDDKFHGKIREYLVAGEAGYEAPKQATV
eukprot:jgi/Mesvir1/14365/Mv09767-RA.1